MSAPSFARRNAVALPMPRDPPVMRATRSVNSMDMATPYAKTVATRYQDSSRRHRPLAQEIRQQVAQLRRRLHQAGGHRRNLRRGPLLDCATDKGAARRV